MNIFFLDLDPMKAAQYHCDSHVRKMILESAQLLSTAHRVLNGIQYIIKPKKRSRTFWILDDPDLNISLYKASHVNHPCAVWVRSTFGNYTWLYKLFCYLCEEYSFRWNKQHKTSFLREKLLTPPTNILFGKRMEPYLAIPEDCKLDSPVQSYRRYYNQYKQHLAKWTKRERPFWYEAL